MGAPCTSRMCNCRLNQRSRPSRRETTPHSRRETQCLRVVSTCETLVWPDLCPCPPSHGIPRHLTISHPHLIVQREERPNESRSSTQLGTRFDFPENLLPLPSCFHRKLRDTTPIGVLALLYTICLNSVPVYVTIILIKPHGDRHTHWA